MDIKELTMEEMGLAFGGWKYDGEHEWLKGQNIACLFPFRCVRRLQKNKAGRSFVINA